MITGVKDVIEFAGQYIIIPYSNSQAHRIAQKYQCSKYFVEDIEALKTLVSEMKKHIRGKYGIVEINDIQWYPTIAEHSEVIENNDVYIEYYNTGITDGYYGKCKNVEINVTDPPF